MGGGASKVKSTSYNQSNHSEPTIVDRVIEALSPRTGGAGSPQKQKPVVQGRNRAFSDPLVRYEPPTKKDDTNNELTIATTSRMRSGEDGSNSNIQRNGSEHNNNSNNNSSNQLKPENSSSSGMKYIFSSIHTLPSFGSSRKRNSNKTHRQTFPNPQVNKNTPTTTVADVNTNNPDENTTNVIFNKRPVDSIKLRERQYWMERKTDAFIVRGSWNEIQILSLLSKPFSGKTITMQSKSKNKYKHVRVVGGVASPRDQK
mmetsp:Transcript_26496/g.28894  ORF Transcript_26496/g.28894 Transcript_26496/m.28894 type:complete len:258 (+) Transcript_26496:174-947(+)